MLLKKGFFHFSKLSFFVFQATLGLIRHFYFSRLLILLIRNNQTKTHETFTNLSRYADTKHTLQRL